MMHTDSDPDAREGPSCCRPATAPEPTDSTDSDLDALDALVAEFTAQVRRGETPSVDDYVRRHPAWAAQLRELLPPVATMEQLKRLKHAARAAAEGAAHLEHLGDYRILREIGRGGMGIVYEAVQQSLGRHVALKVLPGHSLLEPKKLERFRREAQAAAKLHHTHIVPVFGVGEQDGLHYYVMQLIQGQGLDCVLADWRQQAGARALPPAAGDEASVLRAHPPGPSRWQQIARIGLEAAEGLHHAHQQGTLHRDIKPGNLLLDEDGTVWITDFGLAKVVDRDGLTSTGDILGTLLYMAPENLEGRADARSDVYSLGLTLYELLTLDAPFRGQDLSQLLGEGAQREPVSPRRTNPAVPRDLDTIVQKATMAEPAHRYGSALALADDLWCFLEGRPIQARRVTPVERLWRGCRRNPLVTGLTAALVVVFLAGFVGLCWTWHEAAVESVRAEVALRRAADHEKRSRQALAEILDHCAQRTPEGAVGAADAALLQLILKFYDQFAARNATDEKLRRQAAHAHRWVGFLRRRLGQSEEAAVAYRRAADLLEKLARDLPTPANWLDWAETYCCIEVHAAPPGELRVAEEHLHKVLAVAEQADGVPTWKRAALAARASLRLGAVLQQQGYAAEAELAFRRAMRLHQACVADAPDEPLPRLELAVARQTLVEFLTQAKHPAAARALLEESTVEVNDWSAPSFDH
jgi:serine/threonine protein kinase